MSQSPNTHTSYMVLFFNLMAIVCVIANLAQSPNDGLQSKEDLILNYFELNMAAKFVENFIFLWGIGERNDVYNLKLSFI